MLPLFLLVASTHFAALLSPGPDFFLLLRAGLVKGRRHGDGCAAGAGEGAGPVVRRSAAGPGGVVGRRGVSGAAGAQSRSSSQVRLPGA